MLIILTLMMLLLEAIGLGSTDFSWVLNDLAHSVVRFYGFVLERLFFWG